MNHHIDTPMHHASKHSSTAMSPTMPFQRATIRTGDRVPGGRSAILPSGPGRRFTPCHVETAVHSLSDTDVLLRFSSTAHTHIGGG